MPIDSTEWTFGPYTIRCDERVLRFREQEVALAPKLVDTLAAFFREPDRVISKNELIERIWPDAFVDDANLTQNIYVLRRMFEQHQSGVRIENVPKRGYRLVGNPSATPAVERPTVAARSRPRLAWWSMLAPLALVAALGIVAAKHDQRPAASPYGLPAAQLQRYLLGEHYLREGTKASLEHSAADFKELERAAPESAFGYAGLAESDTSLTFYAADEIERSHLSAEASELARRAVAVDGDSAEGYAALGAVETSLERDDAAATQTFRRALQLDGRNLNALLWYGGVLLNGAQPRQARDLFRRALAIDPDVPGAVASLAWADFTVGDYPDAATYSKQLLQSGRLVAVARLTLASADVEMRAFPDALAQIRTLQRDASTRTQALAMLSQIDALRGDRRAARATLQRLESATDPEAVGPWDILSLAAAHARLGQDDSAFAWLDRVQGSERPQLARDPRFGPLRKDRRFRAWLTSAG